MCHWSEKTFRIRRMVSSYIFTCNDGVHIWEFWWEKSSIWRICIQDMQYAEITYIIVKQLHFLWFALISKTKRNSSMPLRLFFLQCSSLIPPNQTRWTSAILANIERTFIEFGSEFDRSSPYPTFVENASDLLLICYDSLTLFLLYSHIFLVTLSRNSQS